MQFFKEFREFAVKGNVVDMGVGIVIGAAFTSVVNSLVKDIFSPLLGLLTAGLNFSDWFLVVRPGHQGGPYRSLLQAQADQAVTLNFGVFLNAMISFLIVSLALFFVVRAINSVRRPHDAVADPADNRECPRCYSAITKKASRCPFCTSDITPEA